MKYYRSDYYNPDAFRIAVTTKFLKEDLKKYHLQAGTVYKVLTAMAGFVSKKNRAVFDKSLSNIAQVSNVCKESAFKAVRFLEYTGHLKIRKGSSRYANKYLVTNKESGVFHTKNGKTLPFITLDKYQTIKALNLAGNLSKTALSFIPYILLHANKNGDFHASKKTICSYSGKDRRTLKKAYDELIENKILIERPLFEKFRTPNSKGQKGFILDWGVLQSFATLKQPETKTG